ncbi:MAG: ACP phosphodiesterase [Lysobacteraceae bacterium]
MNYLAHIFLARQSGDSMLGGILGDFVTPAEGRGFPWAIAREIELHRHIDSFTDRHPVVLDAKRRFRSHTRRFAGPLLDLFFDYALSADWQRYSEQSLRTFIDAFYMAVREREAILPPRFRAVAGRIIEHDWLANYAHIEGVALAAGGVSKRLSRGGERMREGVEDLRTHEHALLADFREFFPELQAFAEQRRQQLEARHGEERHREDRHRSD